MTSSEHHPDAASTFRPAVPPPAPSDWKAPVTLAVLLGISVYWILSPIWPHLGNHMLGDPETDTIRGMWGFDNLRRSMIPPNTPIWTDTINFPEGAVTLILPWISAQVLSPLGGLFGPVVGYNLSVAMLLWAAGFCTAILVYEITASWFAATVVGGVMLAQPMLLHAIADGTPEHLAIWALPLFLAAAHRALTTKTPRWGILAGLMAGVVVLDSPYHAIYAIIAAPIVLPWSIGRLNTPSTRSQLLWTLGTGLAAVILSAGLVFAIYSNFSISAGEDSTELWQMNATDLRSWWRHEFEDTAIREASMAPTLIPSVLMWGGVILCLVGLPRTLPWLVAGIFMILLSLGLNPRLPLHLTFWIGDTAGQQVGRSLLRINETLYELPVVGMIRFPQRWLIPAALCLFTGAGYGLARIEPFVRRIKGPLAVVVMAFAAVIGVQCSHIDLGFPSQNAPQILFAEWLSDDPRSGAVLTVPQTRPPPASGLRKDLPVFANLDSTLTGADTLYFQTIHGRPVVGYPNFKTVTGDTPGAPIVKLLRDFDDLSLPMTSSREIPASAQDPRAAATRQTGLREMYEKGLRWIVIDQGAYNEQAMEIMRGHLDGWIAEETTFDQGDGVLVWYLQPRMAAAQDTE